MGRGGNKKKEQKHEDKNYLKKTRKVHSPQRRQIRKINTPPAPTVLCLNSNSPLPLPAVTQRSASSFFWFFFWVFM